jgi:LPS O-antigen subunit length determinant protein (WzzB/FepE family)
MKETNSIEEQYADEIDLRSILAIFWQHKKLIILGTLGATLLSVGISLLLPRVYRSEGFYQLGNPVKKIAENEKSTNEKSTSKKIASISKKAASIGVPVPLYKSSSTQFFNPNRFKQIAGKDKSFKENDLKEIEANFRTAEDINKWIKPVYAFAKEDAREFAQLPQDESNSVIGLNLAYESDSPESASTYVRYFGKYIRDCLLYVTLYNYVADEYSNTISEINMIENDIIDIKFQLLQNANKMKDIRAILTNYPESAKMENRQLVSVQEKGERFLSPVTQLTLADLRRQLAKLEWDKEKLTIRAEYFTICNSELAKISEHGESIYFLLKSIKDEVFKNKDLSKDTVKEVFNNLNIELQTFELAFFNNSRFVSEPTIPVLHIKPQKSLIVIVSCFISFFVLVIFIFVSHWWQTNKKTIMSTPSL